MSEMLIKLTEAIKAGKRKDAESITKELVAGDTSPAEVLGALISGMEDVGRRFKANEIFVPEVLVSARAMNFSMKILEPILLAAGLSPENTIVIGTVEGDLHDIGKNLVAMMLKGSNFNVVDLGVNVTPEQFVSAVKEHNAKIVALSALLTTTMPSMKAVVDKFRSIGDNAVKIIIGGAPVTQQYATEIGADGYSIDAASAVDLAKSLV